MNDTITITTASTDTTSIVDYDSVYTSTPTYTGSLSTTMSGPTISSISLGLDDLVITDEKRTSVRDSGEIPIDIWAKMYNNGVIDDE